MIVKYYLIEIHYINVINELDVLEVLKEHLRERTEEEEVGASDKETSAQLVSAQIYSKNKEVAT